MCSEGRCVLQPQIRYIQHVGLLASYPSMDGVPHKMNKHAVCWMWCLDNQKVREHKHERESKIQKMGQQFKIWTRKYRRFWPHLQIWQPKWVYFMSFCAANASSTEFRKSKFCIYAYIHVIHVIHQTNSHSVDLTPPRLPQTHRSTSLAKLILKMVVVHNFLAKHSFIMTYL